MGFRQNLVPINFTMSRALGKIKKTYAATGARNVTHDVACFIGHSIAHDENFDVRNSLPQRAGDTGA